MNAGADESETTYEVLLIEDMLPLARSYIEFLRGGPYNVIHVESGKKALNHLRRKSPDIVMLDIKLPDISGLEVLDKIREKEMDCAVVVITAHGSIKLAVDAMRAGAADFLVKPFNAQRLLVTLGHVLDRREIQHTAEKKEKPVKPEQKSGFIGSSPVMEKVFQVIDSVASSKASVFITGESGTGKELCAEAIHRKGPRAAKPFIALNCAAVPRELMESEIFGHIKGAFSGALADRDGAATLADGGTFFLDEICEMNLDLQAKLLRFVQTESFRKVGGSELHNVDIRFICATNRNPLEEVVAGRLREDLYYRLHVIPIHMPPLRERGDDIVELAEHFLAAASLEENKDFSGFAPDALKALLAYNWPGNVRQLQNAIRNIVVLHNGDKVTRDMLPPPLNEVTVPKPIKVVG